MNTQQGLKLPISAQQPVIRQQTSSQRSGRRRCLIIGSSLLTTASLILVAVLLFTSWHTVISATSHTYHPVLTAHEKVRMPLPIPTMQEISTPQDTLITSEVDHLLTDMVTHQQFSGSVLIAHDSHVILSKDALALLHARLLGCERGFRVVPVPKQLVVAFLLSQGGRGKEEEQAECAVHKRTKYKTTGDSNTIAACRVHEERVLTVL